MKVQHNYLLSIFFRRQQLSDFNKCKITYNFFVQIFSKTQILKKKIYFQFFTFWKQLVTCLVTKRRFKHNCQLKKL
jgi:hypothetical protein